MAAILVVIMAHLETTVADSALGNEAQLFAASRKKNQV